MRALYGQATTITRYIYIYIHVGYRKMELRNRSRMVRHEGLEKSTKVTTWDKVDRTQKIGRTGR